MHVPDGKYLICGGDNTATSRTILSRSGGESATPALDIENDSGVAISGFSADGIGVTGDSSTNAGVIGASSSRDGVTGISNSGRGVSGYSWGTFGIFGQTYADGTAAILADSPSDSAGVWGVARGRSTWPAVEGYSYTFNGVRGVSVGGSSASIGVLGYSMLHTGVLGWTDSPSTSSFGGVFRGGLMVFGGPKSTAVPHPDGSHRLLYCVESPESWFEDFGRAKLVRGKAEVKLDVNFAAVVHTDDYRVFLCAEGGVKGLYVNRRDRAGFEVREHEGGTSRATFSYRIVARRKDIKSARLAKVILPRVTGKDLQKTPKGINISKISKISKPSKAVRRFSTIKKSHAGLKKADRERSFSRP
jgi:hypothetical protein